MTTPTTAAGRALLADPHSVMGWENSDNYIIQEDRLEPAILAIEAEARAAGRTTTMTEEQTFIPYPKIYRLNREIIVSEKIDGTNAAIRFDEDGTIITQSRSRIITPEDDNFAFARWAYGNAQPLFELLGPGVHFGEWWGQGIQRNYDMKTKVFSLFNVDRWLGTDMKIGDAILSAVPVLYRGLFDQKAINDKVEILRMNGSVAAPGFMKPEGVVIWHVQGRFGLKVTLEKDEQPKGRPEA